ARRLYNLHGLVKQEDGEDNQDERRNRENDLFDGGRHGMLPYSIRPSARRFAIICFFRPPTSCCHTGYAGRGIPPLGHGVVPAPAYYTSPMGRARKPL